MLDIYSTCIHHKSDSVACWPCWQSQHGRPRVKALVIINKRVARSSRARSIHQTIWTNWIHTFTQSRATGRSDAWPLIIACKKRPSARPPFHHHLGPPLFSMRCFFPDFVFFLLLLLSSPRRGKNWFELIVIPTGSKEEQKNVWPKKMVWRYGSYLHSRGEQHHRGSRWDV